MTISASGLFHRLRRLELKLNPCPPPHVVVLRDEHSPEERARLLEVARREGTLTLTVLGIRRREPPDETTDELVPPPPR